MKRLKILLLISSLLMANSFAGETKFTPSSIATIQSSQAGYGFTDWRTSVTCSYNDNGRIIKFNAKATSGIPAITKYDSVTANPAPATYLGSFADETYTINSATPTTATRRVFKDPTVTFTTVTPTNITGGYQFSYVTSDNLTRNILLFPNGFYVATGNNGLFIPGC